MRKGLIVTNVVESIKNAYGALDDSGLSPRCSPECLAYDLVGPSEAADAALEHPATTAALRDGEIPLSARELEVLALLAEGASNTRP